jgi:hypothetical protein
MVPLRHYHKEKQQMARPKKVHVVKTEWHPDEMISTPEAVVYLRNQYGITTSENTLLSHRHRGVGIPFYKIPPFAAVKYRVSDIDEWVSARSQPRQHTEKLSNTLVAA